MHDVEQAIRERAYQLWIEGGQQQGLADQYWLTAQREILSALHNVSGSANTSVKSKKVTASRRKRAA